MTQQARPAALAARSPRSRVLDHQAARGRQAQARHRRQVGVGLRLAAGVVPLLEHQLEVREQPVRAWVCANGSGSLLVTIARR